MQVVGRNMEQIAMNERMDEYHKAKAAAYSKFQEAAEAARAACAKAKQKAWKEYQEEVKAAWLSAKR